MGTRYLELDYFYYIFDLDKIRDWNKDDLKDFHLYDMGGYLIYTGDVLLNTVGSFQENGMDETDSFQFLHH